MFIAIHTGAGQYSQKSIKKIQKFIIRLIESQDMDLDCLEIIQRIIKELDNCVLFNCGLEGCNASIDGTLTQDCCIMTNDAFGACSVPLTNLNYPLGDVCSPVDLCMFLMKQQDDILVKPRFMYGNEAHAFAQRNGLAMMDSTKVYESIHKSTINRYKAHIDILEKSRNEHVANEKYDTVGCIVMDKFGKIAAATSSGGISLKQPNRIGSSAVVGAGIYVENNRAVLCSGQGETLLHKSFASKLYHANDLDILEIIPKNVGFLMIDFKTRELCFGHSTPGFCFGYSNGVKAKFVSSFTEKCAVSSFKVA